MAKVKNNVFKIHKAKLVPPFFSVNEIALGQAVGVLKPCGLKLYLYLGSNKDGFNWTVNATSFKEWLQSESDEATIRKIIRDGISDLVAHGYATQISENEYEFFEEPTNDT